MLNITDKPITTDKLITEDEMKKSVKAYAKINLTLNVSGINNGFHDIESLVTTVDIYDTITVSARRDDKITLEMRMAGKRFAEDIPVERNNAYKAAKLFVETFKTGGADVKIVKRIPLAGGLGGSSADAAGVLNAMKALYDVSEDVKPLADMLGSDTGYMTSGGFAVISGRGERVEKIESETKLYLVLIYANSGVNTAECYKKFDELGAEGLLSDNLAAAEAVKNDDLKMLGKCVGNALYLPAAKLNKEVESNLGEIKSLSPTACGMTGSGSTVFGIFETEELCRWAVDKLRKKDLDCEYVCSVDPSKKSGMKRFFV